MTKLIAFAKNIYRQLRFQYWWYKAKDKGPMPTQTASDKPVVLFFLPESGIRTYITALVKIATDLKQQGYAVKFVRCFNLLSRCLFMDSERLAGDVSNTKKKELCAYCFRSFEQHVIQNGFEFVDLRHFTQESDLQFIEQAIKLNPKQPFEFIYDGIDFSGILEYNILLYLKRFHLENLQEPELKLWQDYLRGLFVAYQSMKRVLAHHHIQQVVMCEQYSLNFVMKKLMQANGIPITSISFPFHKDVDFSKIRFIQSDVISESFEVIHKWPAFESLALPSSLIKEIVDDLIIRMSKKGIYTYSPSKTVQTDLFTTLGLSHERKTVVAYPSSPDEIYNLLSSYKRRGLPLVKPEDAFSDQFDWLDTLIDYIEQSPDLQLVVRLHPRMAPNHREQWGCEDTHIFMEKYDKAYKYVKIIWPQDDISSYDVAEIADVVTVAWSSMGLFMARLGLPVISGIKLSTALPDEDFHRFSKTKENYLKTLQELTRGTVKADVLLKAYRFYAVQYLGHCIPFGKSEALKSVMIDQCSVIDHNLRLLQECQSEAVTLDEAKTLGQQLSRLVHFLMTNQDNWDPRSSPQLTVVDNIVRYQHEGCRYEKHSPMIAQLSQYALTLRNGATAKIADLDTV